MTIALRNGLEIQDPLPVVLGCHATWCFEPGDRSSSFAESDLRLANRGGARISAAEIASILGRRRAIERPPHASRAGATGSVPWPALRQLFDAFSHLRGVGLSKTTKGAAPQRPALIPMLDSVVQAYVADDDPGVGAPFGERSLARSYKRDLDRERRCEPSGGSSRGAGTTSARYAFSTC